MTKLWMALQMRKMKYKENRDNMTKVNLVVDESYQVKNNDKENFRELQDELKPFTLEDLMNIKRFHSLNLIKTKDG
jgi:hypothetical protein